MDIDNFLDSEAGKEKDSSSEHSVFQPDLEEEKITEPDLQNDKEITEPDLTNDTLDEETTEDNSNEEPEKNSLEDKHTEIWGKIFESNLVWKDSLHSDALNYITKVQKESQNQKLAIDKNINYIYKLIDQSNKILDFGNYKESLILYEKITQLKDNIPNIFFQNKVGIQSEITKLYNRIHSTIDTNFVQDAKNKIETIEYLIKTAFSKYAKGKINGAKRNYFEAINLYRQISPLLILPSLDVGNKLLKLYKQLSIDSQIKSLSEKLKEDAITETDKTNDKKINKLTEMFTSKSIPPAPRYDDNEFGMHKHKFKGKVLDDLISRKIERAKIHLEKGFFIDARKDLESAIKLDPNNVDAIKLLSIIKET